MNALKLKYQFDTGIQIQKRIDMLPTWEDKMKDLIDYIDWLETKLTLEYEKKPSPAEAIEHTGM